MNWEKENFYHHKAKQYVTAGDPENISNHVNFNPAFINSVR